MFTAEVRINSDLILHIYGYNTAIIKEGKTQYAVTVYNAETMKLKKLEIYHLRKDGIAKLISIILTEYNAAK